MEEAYGHISVTIPVTEVLSGSSPGWSCAIGKVFTDAIACINGHLASRSLCSLGAFSLAPLDVSE